ncbi:MAG: transcription termination factor Rho [Chloroflexi bacterium]|jgi:transcription termination factor Rho|nr:transcription termination factor Rho [Chloroflexota bacterium]MBV6438226.1 Transcription termination factor Rho [Anaerolineae bacterium]MDL1916687.1 transcription termination factor Rho [Anaerolineae bacterium CFX4]MBW7879849.1 transcription termination factor Rho [Anaerolineae bacterium]MCC6566437.1 transcription termination factor Rho [Chloroflexota bacterium]
MDIAQLEQLTLDELRQQARDAGIQRYSRLKKPDLILQLMRADAERRGLKLRGGVLEITHDGVGFLRADKYLPGPNDIYVAQAQIKRFNLRTGDMVIGQVRPPKDNEKYHGLLRVDAVNGIAPDENKVRPNFEDLTPIFPEVRFDLETSPRILSTRLLNLIAPIGRGQRGLIVSPPKAGKTTILKEIANAISRNYPDVHLMMVLIGERPEEVTDMDRSVDAEVVASTFDDPVHHHVQVAEMALERAKRLVEGKKDVVLLVDSITRLARAYNLVVPTSGRTLSGGLDPMAIQPPKRFFGAARNVEEGGSLTIVATCLVNTGSKMDDLIYEEFKGTGNMELHLSRKLQERRVFPAFDVEQSSTRREELLLGPDVLQRVYLLRRMWSHLAEDETVGQAGATEQLLQTLRQYDSNEEFLNSLTSSASTAGAMARAWR